MFEYAYDLSGVTYPVMGEHDILDANDIRKGELIKLLAPAASVLGGRVTSLTATYTSIAGVAAEDKVANDGKVKMKIYESPSAVFKVDAITTSALTAGSGSGTWGCTDLISGTTTGSDELLNGGKIKIKTKAASSTMTKNVGDVINITAYDAVNSTNGIITVAVGTPITGDVAYLFPPISGKFVLPTPTDTDHNMGIAIPAAGTAAGACLIVVGHDLENNKILVKVASNVHQFAGHA
ncbi:MULTISPECIES: hypothetical protein [unclassified Dehalobacter]|jgi:hypothetical protein|uniref:hypothetical protein n=1 Tax=unclassified Dehalobacter TaxID=2635733 RepID=UPI00028A8C99|nr:MULTISPECIES: hypothetical protein [unclassified Dehalobacter]AFV02824.1 hypothetical protein DHBDCA_p1798 [Dehalobacter sp. DCA]AFV05810.1 hypothetical protein DCF50_p1808 [Dehalobacter sp. CF]